MTDIIEQLYTAELLDQQSWKDLCEDAANEIETLRRSLAAARLVIKSKEAIQSIQNGRLKDMNEAINTLASEREANAVMTEEIETLRQRMKELEQSLAKVCEKANSAKTKLAALEQQNESVAFETLRQRVAELEESEKSWIERGNYWTDEAAKINAELAEFKRSQQVAPEQGQSNRYCPVGGNCSDASDCDGSCAPYIGRGQQGEPVAFMFKVWDGRRLNEFAAVDYEPQHHEVYGWEVIKDKQPLYTSAPTVPEGCFSAADMADAAAKAAQVEREECARLCEDTDQEYEQHTGTPKRLNYACANAIRMRGDQ